MLVDGVDDCSTFDFDSSNANVAALDVAEEAPSSLAVSVNLPPGDYALIVSVPVFLDLPGGDFELECGNEGNYTLELIDGPIEGLCPDKVCT